MSEEKNPLEEVQQEAPDPTGNPFPSSPPVNCDNPDEEQEEDQ